MDEGKRKRNRKRSRRSKGGADIEGNVGIAPNAQEEKLDNGLDDARSDHDRDQQEAGMPPAAHSGETQNTQAGPSLSFYERTNPHKPSALPSLTATAPRKYTVSVAIPGSIILNAQTPELQSRLAGNIARSCAIFNVDEIIVFDEGKRQDEQEERGNGHSGRKRHFDDAEAEDVQIEQYEQVTEQAKARFDPNAFLARILQYVETPQYLRKSLFPMHRDLRLAGLLPPLDCPHHLRFEDQSPFREGVCVDPPHWAQRNHQHASQCFVNIGLRDPLACTVQGPKKNAAHVPVGARVTVRMPKTAQSQQAGQIVSPRTPAEEKGLYWGYSVRLCGSLSDVLRGSPYADPYDLVVGTSERGTSLTDLALATSLAKVRSNKEPQAGLDKDLAGITPLAPFKHALIMFGGLSGLEVAVERDAAVPLNADEASQLFDAWINIVEGQGSRTIRTEEALLITLSRLRPLLDSVGQS